MAKRADPAATLLSTMWVGNDADLAHGPLSRVRNELSVRGGHFAVTDPEQRHVVQDELELEASLDQIAAWLRVECPDRPRSQV